MFVTYEKVFSNTIGRSSKRFKKSFRCISYQYKFPLTALKYLKEIYAEMRKLEYSAISYQIQTRKHLQQYGPFPRRVNYKKMAIIYNVINDVVYIRRVIPANTISGL